MAIKRIVIENFKCFNGRFSLELNDGLNLIVGDNEAGKSTIIEAIHLALTGYLGGRFIKGEISSYLFNQLCVRNYLESIKSKAALAPPAIKIEIHFSDMDHPELEGDDNEDSVGGQGFRMTIAFDAKYQDEYAELIKTADVKSLPVEYYDVSWITFSRDIITPKSIPVKSSFIDSVGSKAQNGSDLYVSRIIKDSLAPKELIDVSQAYRKMRESFSDDQAIISLNTKIKDSTKMTSKSVRLAVDMSSRMAWEGNLIAHLDETPFHHVGKGEQCIVKTNLALGSKRSQKSDVVLIEEPENHLSHSNLNKLLHEIQSKCTGKQIIITTHSSFVANKIGIRNIIILHNQKTVKLNDLSDDTQDFFMKLSGYDTLRLILCKGAILVEGDSDELIVQRAYIDKNGRLPIEDRIDVISVGTSFLRFLEIAVKVEAKVAVVSDNDGDFLAVSKKYSEYLKAPLSKFVKICIDDIVDATTPGGAENSNTLEPKILKENGLASINSVLGTDYDSVAKMQRHMKISKTECALRIFNNKNKITYPKYILDSIAYHE